MILALEILSIVTALLALASLAVAIFTFEGRFDQIQTARERSAYDTCRILGALINRSAQLSHHQQEARAFLRSVGLADCRTYARNVRHGTL